MKKRIAAIKRATKETDITVKLNIDGTGESTIGSGNGFMDHMLTLFARHGLFDLKVACIGDTDVDFHHSVEDVGICLGKAFSDALAPMVGITRFGHAYVPMDDTLARVCIDLCGRSTLVYNAKLPERTVNDFPVSLARDFFKSFTDNAHCTMHIDLIRCDNSHHGLEAIFKAFGRALSTACLLNPRAAHAIPSTKGVL